MLTLSEYKFSWIAGSAILAWLIFATCVFTKAANAEEPCPESLTDSRQILVCYFPTYSADGARVRGVGEEWIVTWGMCKTWEPGKWILFVDKHGRRTKLPQPKEYVCDVL